MRTHLIRHREGLATVLLSSDTQASLETDLAGYLKAWPHVRQEGPIHADVTGSWSVVLTDTGRP